MRDFVFRQAAAVARAADRRRRDALPVSGQRTAESAARLPGLLKLFGKLAACEQLSPPAEIPFFFRQIGKTFPAEGERQYRVAMMAGCIANISFARLNEATVRVLQKNGCEVVIPAGQTCCGALHVHAGIRDQARKLARQNIDAVLATGRLRRDHHQRGRLRIDAEGIRRTVRARSGVAEKARSFQGADEGRHRIPGVDRAESAK